MNNMVCHTKDHAVSELVASALTIIICDFGQVMLYFQNGDPAILVIAQRIR